MTNIQYRLREWATKLALWVVVRMNSDSNFLAHIRREVPDWFEEEGPNRWIADGTVDLLAVFASQGHSGSSAPFAVNFFKTMAAFKPWGPLTGEESEWGEPINHDGTQQNRRCSHVFRNVEGEAYDIQGKVFTDLNGCSYTSRESRVDVTFPYTPHTEYVDVESS